MADLDAQATEEADDSQTFHCTWKGFCHDHRVLRTVPFVNSTCPTPNPDDFQHARGRSLAYGFEL